MKVLDVVRSATTLREIVPLAFDQQWLEAVASPE
jgi:hypothetical protein